MMTLYLLTAASDIVTDGKLPSIREIESSVRGTGALTIFKRVEAKIVIHKKREFITKREACSRVFSGRFCRKQTIVLFF